MSFNYFINSTIDLQKAYAFHYDYPMVVASVLIAIFASFCALEMTERLARGELRVLWLSLGALILGAGVWAMHFIGMLAFRLECGVTYDTLITGLSMLPGILAAAVALDLIAKDQVSRMRLLFAGVVMALGIGVMHYAGMAAIQLDGILRYDLSLFLISLLAAVLLAVTALRLKFFIASLPVGHTPFVSSLMGGVVMGGAISCMHYIAMEAAFFVNQHPDGNETVIVAASPTILAIAVSVVAILLILAGLIFTFLGTRIANARNRIEAILATTSHGFVLIDNAGSITECNRAMSDLLGRNQDSIINKPFCNLVASDNGQALEGNYQREVNLIHADGRTVPCLVHGNAVTDEHGKLLYSFALFSDISERIQAEQQLRAREQQFQSLLESTPDPMVIVDTHGKITMANRQALSFFGYGQDELVGHSVELLIPPRFRGGHSALFNGYVNHNETRPMGSGRELYALTRDGNEVAVEISLSPIQTDDGVLIASALRDITKRKLAEELLREAMQQAEEATRMKSDFLANMSHEIRTPMNAIIGLSHLVMKSDMTPRQRDYLKKIQDSSQHLLGIINDILDFSKIEAGKLSMEHIEFDLENVLGNVSGLIHDKANDKGLELIFDVAPDVPNTLIGDPLRIGQVLINFGSNAIKFTEQGEINIVVRKIEDTGQEVLLKFSVKDTGIGLNQEQMDKLFQSFQQADTSTTRKYGGTGLGLAICKSLAEMMDGEVGVNSRLDKGSEFWFTARLGKTKQRRILAPHPDLRGKRVLVVDDNEHARAVLVDLLTSLTFRVGEAYSGRNAIEVVKQAASEGEPYDAVFIDWQMPNMDGIEAARAIRGLGLLHSPKEILVTAYGREEVLRSASLAEIDEVLIKPVNPSTLFDCVVRAFADEVESKNTYNRSHDAAEIVSVDDIIGARILVVEDNEINQQIARELLEDAGFVVDVADNGQIALEQVQRQDYDIVLMDMQMPVMDGLTATIEMRKIHRLADLPIVAMTANAMQQDREHCLAAGMDDHLAKPIEPNDLWTALRKWIKPQIRQTLISQVAVPQLRTEIILPDGIAGLDTTAGLRRVIGKRELYLSLLNKFVATQENVVEEIRTALQSQNYVVAERLAHTLKGLSGNIGAPTLQELAGQLEKLIREHQSAEAVAKQLETVSYKLSAMVSELKAQLQSTDKEEYSTAEIDEAQLTSIVIHLARLLESDNADASDYLDAHIDLLRNAFPEQIKPLKNAIDAFDFQAALSPLKQAAALQQITW